MLRRSLVRIRRSDPVLSLLARRQWRAKRRIALRSGPVLFDISERMGMGAMMTQFVMIMSRAEALGIVPVIRFTNPLYGEVSGRDWIGDFFDPRFDAPADACIGTAVKIRNEMDQDYLIGSGQMDVPTAHRIFKSRLGLSTQITDEVARFEANYGPMAECIAIHYRGTDKIYEAKRVTADAIERLVPRALERAQARRIFLATDEPAFETWLRDRHPGVEILSYLRDEVDRTRGGPIHFAHAPGYWKGIEAVVNIVLFSRSAALVRTPSYFSAWAKVLRPDLAIATVGFAGLDRPRFPDSELVGAPDPF